MIRFRGLRQLSLILICRSRMAQMIWLKKKLKGLFNKNSKKGSTETSVEFRQMRCPYSNLICIQFPLKTEEEKRDPKAVCDRCEIGRKGKGNVKQYP